LKTLQEAKREISSRFIGLGGIQGVGTRASENAVCVYLDKGVSLQAAVWEQLNKTAAPYAVITEEAGRAIAADGKRARASRLLRRIATRIGQ
jgi:hypothetical protein